ncbi:hypothetical protein [Nocardioides sp. WS12]|uniref:J domain-containing protein n=1 Tax=Nocardioides sp. WS12 TaxID=2486272 RepID=UPI0015FC3A0D|nr:hypothetical protein [Nocardioides sp. WS12]
MSVNNYDLLNVDESATADEIRAAWKVAIADLDPSDRRFRAYNDAAGVLLDEEKRASYDAGLAEARAEAEAEVEAEVEPDAVVEEPAAPAAATNEKAEPADTSEKADKPDEPAVEPRTPSDGPRKATLIGVGVAAALAVVLAIWTFTLAGVRADESPQDIAERSQAQDKATLAVESAAEQMVTPVLSYNHKTMAEDLERLKGFLTTKMADKQSAAWPELTKEAQAQEIVVEATPTGTALTRVDPDGKRATVVVFIDQYVEKKANEPFVLHMWATMSLVREGGDGGRWLLDDLCTDDSCG